MKNIEPLLPVMRQGVIKIYYALLDGGPNTADAIADLAGLKRRPTVTAELSAMHVAGLIHIHEWRRVGSGPQPRMSQVWALGQASDAEKWQPKKRQKAVVDEDIEAFMSRARKRKLAEHNRTFKPTRDKAASWI